MISGTGKINADTRNLKFLEETDMCPACFASTAAIVAGAGSTGGILAVCIGKFKRLFKVKSFQIAKEN